MKTILILSFSLILFGAYSQEIRFFSSIKSNTVIAGSVSYGFLYRNKLSERKIGSFFGTSIYPKKYGLIDLKVNGEPHIGTRDEFVFNKSQLLKNEGKVYLSFRSPRDTSVVRYDTLTCVYPTKIELLNNEVHSSQGKELRIRVYYSNNSSVLMESKDAYDFLEEYGFSLTSEGVVFELESVSLSSRSTYRQRVDSIPIRNKYRKVTSVKLFFKCSSIDSNVVDSSVGIRVNSPLGTINEKVIVSFTGFFNIHMLGEDGGKASSYGKPGDHGSNLTLNVSEVNDSLFSVEVFSHGRTVNTFVLDPRKSRFSVFTSGGDGSDGCRGDNGRDALNYNQVSSSGRQNLGQKGEDGYSGGDGGNGGDVIINYPLSFETYKHIFVIHNQGGNGGEGGAGGKGGRDQITQEPKLLDVLVPDRAPYGRDGRDGNFGRNGKIQFVLK